MAKTTDMKGKEVKSNDIFWLEGFEGKCQSGYYFRSDLFKQFAKLEEMGHRVIGIKVEPNSWNIEFILSAEENKQ